MIKVLVVDDSAVVRQILSKEISRARDIEVVATAPDPYIAREKILRYRPDVMTLDIEMPRMDGITFLRKVMRHFPIPTIVISSLTPEGSKMMMDALSAGAIDVIVKPGESYTIGDVSKILIDQIRAASLVSLEKISKIQKKLKEDVPRQYSLTTTTNKIIAIGASTGGTMAIEYILKQLPKLTPGLVIVQHMPEKFTHAFAERLNSICEIEVKECANGDAITPGLALIAPGNFHTIVKRSGARYHVEVKDGPPVYHQRPSVEVLFNSVAKYVGSNAIGVILTGMGEDGATGLLAMKEAGAHTLAQDENSSVIWGMPGEAVKIGAAEKVVSLQNMAAEMVRLSNR